MSKAELINEAKEADGAIRHDFVSRSHNIDVAIKAIRVAVENNAAPMNAIFALKELASQGEHITLDPTLLLDLFEAQSN